MSQRPGSSDGGRKAGGAQRVRSAPSRQGDAAQIDGVEQQRAYVDVPAVGGRGDLLGNLALCASGSSPDNAGLAALDEEAEHQDELARAQRVVREDGGCRSYYFVGDFSVYS